MEGKTTFQEILYHILHTKKNSPNFQKQILVEVCTLQVLTSVCILYLKVLLTTKVK